MKLAAILLPLAAMGLAASPALAADSQPGARAAIPFVNHDGVRDWRAENDRTVYFEDSHRQWYKAQLVAPAFDLPYAEHIAIDSGPNGTLDQWGAILVHGQRYPFLSFEKVAGPPPSRHAKAAKPAKAAS
ncbi:DUF6491 family protein [Novosphingobium album (ex Liu et al. 2023)]|uniref:DUF6491 family protein n=1 Tax=Novosphingobium album (ex Liu et al. 2023) TaxID=3031130 RepID=A0ABT5WSQ4_9SPHN|nr:DUF6491 family protein [Novosphingobium album (ex Liu et al. 2023)]MDE8653057.1 DUF6491 family protein [Novosphingobium album (ex Liu et al. 2023)]